MKRKLVAIIITLLILSMGMLFACKPSGNNNSDIEENDPQNEINNGDEANPNYAHLEMGAEIVNLKTYSNGVEQMDASFENGGTVQVNDKGLYINGLSQNDKITYDWIIVNKSNLDVKYKPYMSLPSETSDNLKVKINGESLDKFLKRQWKFVKFSALIKNIETVNVEIEASDNNQSLSPDTPNGQIELFTKVVGGNEDILNEIKVTPDNIENIDFTLDETQYSFYGTFINPTIKAFSPKNVRQIYDGTNAIINGQLKIYFQEEISDFKELVEGNKMKEKNGEYKVRNFKYVTDSITVIANGTKLRIENNNCPSMDLAAPNCETEIINNVINAMSKKHKRFDGGLSSYGFYYYNAINYTCRFDANSVSNTLGHAVVFHGNFGVLTNYNWENVDLYNVKNEIASFQNNEIAAASGKACLKFWDDHQYCANQAYNNANHIWNNAALDKPEEDMIAFIKKQYNTFNLSNTNSHIFSFYDVSVNDVPTNEQS